MNVKKLHFPPSSRPHHCEIIYLCHVFIDISKIREDEKLQVIIALFSGIYVDGFLWNYINSANYRA
ncbi:hypothetical protein HMPREF3034_00651 [Prevotella sp. DNF00663]|nr:hypothetical protein HMPREF3034_00651 [Prevotella sp. DNF00663]